MHHIAQALNSIRQELSAFYLEREEAIEAMLLALVAGEHAFILGPPGTAKSQLVRALVRAVMGARYFEILLSKTRPAEAVLGPLNIKEFRENGNYYLKRAGFASQVELAMLDEVGKMSPVLGHDLLALLNERVYHEVNGNRSVHPAPLSTAFCPSNEMITQESDDAAALWDRLLVRVTVDYMQDKANFARLLTNTGGQVTTTIDWDDLHKVITDEVPNIPLSDDALKGMVKLRQEFARQHMYPSDRRWRASVKVLQASAFLAGRDEVAEDDLAALRFTLWDTAEQIESVRRLCMSAANPFVEPLMEIRDAINEIAAGISQRENDTDPSSQGGRLAYGKEANQKLGKARDRLDMLLLEAMGRQIPGFKAVSELHKAQLLRNYMVCLEQPEEVAEIAVTKKLGSGDGGNLT